MSALDQAEFRNVVGHFATGVTVVTSACEAGPSGMTASAFTSLSLDPLLVLICFDRDARTLEAVRASGGLAINILRHDQAAIAEVFAGKGPESEKFVGVGWRDHNGLPLIEGTIAWLTGTVEQLVEGGDHYIAIVRVTDLDSPGGEPLLYYRGGFAGLGRD